MHNITLITPLQPLDWWGPGLVANTHMGPCAMLTPPGCALCNITHPQLGIGKAFKKRSRYTFYRSKWEFKGVIITIIINNYYINS